MERVVMQCLRDDIEDERGRLIEAMVSRNSWNLDEARKLAELQGAIMAFDAELAMPPRPAPTGPRVEYGEDGWPKK